MAGVAPESLRFLVMAPAIFASPPGGRARTSLKRLGRPRFVGDDVEGAVKSLSDKGVVFEEYDSPTFKTVNEVCVLGSEKAAWFKDTEGNVLCIHQTI